MGTSSKLGELLAGIGDAFRQAKRGYEEESRFGRMRIWVIGAFGLDVVLTLVLVIFSGGRPLPLDAWFEEGFPSNLIIVKNDGPRMDEVQLTIDSRYGARVRHLEPGPAGLEINREFRDKGDFPPPDGYRPQKLLIQVDGTKMELELRRAEKR